MNCQILAARIQQVRPEAELRDVARLCLLLANSVGEPSVLEEDSAFRSAWRETGMRLQAATDQHAAMMEELEDLARTEPRRFTPDQIWVLIRAIKVQGQILELYMGSPTASCVD
ncbi:MAG: hypothetical protein FJ297_03840 [Planctomycetes bacterium]|nr:hypothetical protein [Planctomycetota bacterium]